MDAEMASWKSTHTYVDEAPPPGANIVSGMWIFKVKRPPRSPPVFKARYVARGFSQRLGVDFFQTFSPTPKMTTLRDRDSSFLYFSPSPSPSVIPSSRNLTFPSQRHASLSLRRHGAVRPSYAEAIEGPYSSQWQAAMDAEMASWKSTGTYVDEVPPPGANIASGMWIFRVKRPPGSPPAFKARYVARGFSQRHGFDFFQTFSPTPKMTTLRVLLHVAAQRDYELHSLDFSTAFLQGSVHEEIWLRRPPGFTGSFLTGTQWSLRRPVYGLRQAPREWHDTLRTTLAALGFAPSTADPSLFLRTDATLPPFYVLVYVDDLVFATADTEALAHVKSELQKRHTCTDLATMVDGSKLQVYGDAALHLQMGPLCWKPTLPVTNIKGLDLILGRDFLKKFNPEINWVTRTASIYNQDRRVPLPNWSNTGDIPEETLARFEKDVKRTMAGFVALVTNEDEGERKTLELPPAIQKLLEEFEDILPGDLPDQLQPYRTHQHEIIEEPGSKPTF
ncbi:unnamed protein product [Closterium sp. NIES-53]